jgi:hypothetical protein
MRLACLTLAGSPYMFHLSVLHTVVSPLNASAVTERALSGPSEACSILHAPAWHDSAPDTALRGARPLFVENLSRLFARSRLLERYLDGPTRAD